MSEPWVPELPEKRESIGMYGGSDVYEGWETEDFYDPEEVGILFELDEELTAESEDYLLRFEEELGKT